MAQTTEILSDTELDHLRLIAQGYTRKEIARRLFKSIKTCDSHRTSLMLKLGVNSTIRLALRALKLGLTSLDDVPDEWRSNT